MRDAHRILVVAAIGAVTATCAPGSQSLLVTANPEPLSADGASVVELSAKVTFRGDPLRDGQRVAWTANHPLLFDAREDAIPTVVGGRQSGETSVSTTTLGGAARVYLLAPSAEITITVTASYTTVNKDTLSDTKQIAVGPPPLVSAGSNVSGDLSAVIAHFGFQCDGFNIGGFVTGRDEIVVPCGQVTLKDQAGNVLHHVPIHFYLEAGEMRVTPATAKQPRSFVYVVPNNPILLPRDTRARGTAEESLMEFGAGLIPGAQEQNPRDGLVTILAVVRGHEAYDDRNGNGQYDLGEPFIDEGEPFLDVDDDGTYDMTYDGNHCCDSNNNGSVDPPNGKWDNNVWIGRMTHVLWSGPLVASSARSRIEPASVAIPGQGSQTFTLRLLDANGNPLAANSSGDAIELTASSLPTGRITFDPPATSVDLQFVDTYGMLLTNKYPLFVFGRGDAVFQNILDNGSVLTGREWKFTLKDKRSPSSGTTICRAGTTWSIATEAKYTPGDGLADLFDDTSVVATGGLDADCSAPACIGLDPCPN